MSSESVTNPIDKTGTKACRPCTGGLRPDEKETTDDSSWYVVIVRQRNELVSRRILDGMKNLDFQLETYVAAQKLLSFSTRNPRKVIERVVIPSKIFIRVDEQHRQEVLKLCPYLSGYMTDPSLNLTANGFRKFARVADSEIRTLRKILELVDAPVEYFDAQPKRGDKIQVLTGQFHGLKGVVCEEGGKKRVTVILDKLGTFRFTLPIDEVGQIKQKSHL